MSERSIADEAEQLRQRAEAGPIGKRHSSFELYALLADCMALADRCRDPGEYEALRMAITMQGGDGGPRRYVERNSDEYILVCRYVFSDRKPGKERSNASRYAHALREAAKRQINSKTLEAHLRTAGGINALFLARPLEARSCTLKTLYLAHAITVPKQGWFTVSLSRKPDGSFEVKEMAA